MWWYSVWAMHIFTFPNPTRAVWCLVVTWIGINLMLNAGWNYGGFKASPASGWYFADLIANDRPDDTIAHFDLKRFERGVIIDERGAGPDPKLHG